MAAHDERGWTDMVTVAAATPADAPAIAGLLREMDEFYGGSAREPARSKLSDVHSALFSDQPWAFALLAWDQSRLAGLACFSFLWPVGMSARSLYLKDLYVRRDCRGHGVGRLLMSHVFEVARASECSRVEWTTDRDNHGAQVFYQNLGAEPLPSKLFYRAHPTLLPGPGR
jgi:GNAT superfamily N-acetyltransferase